MPHKILADTLAARETVRITCVPDYDGINARRNRDRKPTFDRTA
ncbi:hypothetical protein [Mesorhizobium qingshengii]|uniref:Uncharacterized protein n=1 Tax=Mesorhizobium qingshengii TaxID=1165689 RepID=A0A1G5VAQ1_9HYPH|nr:hypothetical protein [Mesorhizobium qingshengii]SDA42476.1 hypothetical protein SAMN02927914_00431 [Mesorhizobium qingshengii]